MAMDLGKQVGPLPLGAWIVVVAGGLGIAVWQRNTGNSDPTPVEDTSGTPGVGTGDGMVGVTPLPGYGNTPSTGTGVTYDTNEAWGQAAINWLIAQGYQPGLASSAITKALNGGQDVSGNKMSIAEWSLWTLALTKFGSPPTPVNVPPPSSVPGPVTQPPPPPVKKPPPSKPPVKTPAPVHPPTKPGIPPYTSVKVSSSDPNRRTVSAIAAHYGHGQSWQTVWNFNLKYRPPATAALLRARGPNLVFNGTTIWVPK